ACSSTSDNNTGGGDNTQTQTITPQIKSTSTLSGALSSIYNPANSSNTNALIADEIKKNLTEVFDNGDALNNVNDLEITVTHSFPESTWTGLTFNSDTGNWGNSTNAQDNVEIQEANKLLYPTQTTELNISYLSDLKEQLNDDAKLEKILDDAGATVDADTVYSVNNGLGFTNKNSGSENRDLLHVNVVGTKTTAGQTPTTTTTNYDLQIPVSDLNLEISNLSVTVKGSNVTETTATTNFTYNIGINDAENYVDPSTKPTATEEEAGKLDDVLVKLGYATAATGGATETTLNNDAIIQGLGIYNVTFARTTTEGVQGIVPKEDASNNGNEKTYTITLSATPNQGYVWEDGTSNAKDISFDVILDITAAAQS
ncbi:hypothetical protein D8X55_05005, partial [Malacoplasma penetrans]|uniref:P35 family lipoprotein n=1 Tax=Malacoplasma penetrans TaxID=28227 RepID=UPI0010128989